VGCVAAENDDGEPGETLDVLGCWLSAAACKESTNYWIEKNASTYDVPVVGAVVESALGKGAKMHKGDAVWVRLDSEDDIHVTRKHMSTIDESTGVESKQWMLA